jgi:hypothetical protein
MIESDIKNNRKYFALAGACMVFLSIGFPYSWGVMSVYVRQYFNHVEGINME